MHNLPHPNPRDAPAKPKIFKGLISIFQLISKSYISAVQPNSTECPEKQPPKQNAVTCTVYNTIPKTLTQHYLSFI